MTKNESLASHEKTYGDLNNTMLNDQLLADMKAKYGRDIDEYLATKKDTPDSIEIRTDISDMAKASNDHEKLSQYLAIKLENEFQTETRDNRTQLARLKNSLSNIPSNIETQNEIPFDILGGTIEIYDLLKGKNKTKFVLGKRTIEREGNLYKATLEYNNRPFTVLLEYSKGSNVILVHDKRYNEVIPVPIISTHVNKQHINKLSPNNLDITSYETFRPIEIKTRRYQLDLILAFKK